MPTIAKYSITVHTPDGDVVRRFNNPGWMIAALNANPEWVVDGDHGDERTLRNERAVGAVVVQAEADRAARKAAAAAVREWRAAHPEGLPLGDSRHGTNGYGNHGCRCTICTDAWAADYYQRAHLTPRYLEPGDPRHGSASAFHYWHCHCRICLDGHAARQRDYEERRRAGLTGKRKAS